MKFSLLLSLPIIAAIACESTLASMGCGELIYSFSTPIRRTSLMLSKTQSELRFFARDFDEVSRDLVFEAQRYDASQRNHRGFWDQYHKRKASLERLLSQTAERLAKQKKISQKFLRRAFDLFKVALSLRFPSELAQDRSQIVTDVVRFLSQSGILDNPYFHELLFRYVDRSPGYLSAKAERAANIAIALSESGVVYRSTIPWIEKNLLQPMREKLNEIRPYDEIELQFARHLANGLEVIFSKATERDTEFEFFFEK